MNKIIDHQFQRVDAALKQLVTSIAQFNPNSIHAAELVAADQDLAKGLDLLSTHQKNVARIQALRAESSNLDEQIRSNLSLLATTRAELIATPATDLPSNHNPVSYSELLSFARRISKFTRPPTFREDEPAVTPMESQEVEIKVDTPGATGTQVNGNTPAAMSPVSPAVTNGVVPVASNDAAEGGDENTTALPNAISAWINPAAVTPAFIPWPSEQKIRQGALASIQLLRDRGIDPATFDPEKAEELEAERKRLEEEELAKREAEKAERQRLQAERQAREEARRRESMAAAPEAGEKREVKTFTGLDLLDDEDDD